MADLIVPIVHLNGSGKLMLTRERKTAVLALHTALDALKQMAPNGRDYYLQTGLLEKAQEQHRRRAQALQDLIDEITEECEAILAQGR